MVGWFIRGGKKVAETITKVKPGTKFTGQKTKESIIEAGKKFKSKLADEAKKAQEAEFKKKPWKKMGISKKEYDDIPF
jgi:hypothetical protein